MIYGDHKDLDYVTVPKFDAALHQTRTVERGGDYCRHKLIVGTNVVLTWSGGTTIAQQLMRTRIVRYQFSAGVKRESTSAVKRRRGSRTRDR